MRTNLYLGTLLNFTNGGEGSSGYKHSIKTKNKISNSLKGKNIGQYNPNFGKFLTEEHKRKISEIRKNKFKIGKLKILKGDESGHHKLIGSDIIQIKLLLKNKKLTSQKISDIFEVNYVTISDIKTEKTWSHFKI